MSSVNESAQATREHIVPYDLRGLEHTKDGIMSVYSRMRTHQIFHDQTAYRAYTKISKMQ